MATSRFDWRLTDDEIDELLLRLVRLGPAGIASTPDLLAATRLWTDGTVDIHYAPFHGETSAARLIIVGLTPGFQQMQLACKVAAEHLAAGGSRDAAFRAVKATASFAGTMRDNLVAMLDGIGVPAALGVANSAELFGARRDLLHTTSALRYPVFTSGRNYGGQPSLLRHAVLRAGVETLLREELEAVPGALVLPLGKNAGLAVGRLMACGAVAAERCAFGLPYPSGANGHRASEFVSNRDNLTAAVRDWYGN